MREISNATKAQAIIAINALMAVLVEFGIDLSEKQQAAIAILVNALLSLYIGLTFKQSGKRKTV